MWMRMCRLRCGRLCRRRGWGKVVGLCVAGFIFGLMALVSFGYYFRHQLFDTFVKCTDKDSRRFIDDFCGLYKQGVITGSLCRPLCETGEVKFDRCTNFHAGKEVHLMNCTNFCRPQQTIPAVLKSSKINATMVLKDHPNVDMGDDITTMLKHQIRQLVVSDLGFLPFDTSDAIRVMWDEGFDQYLSDPVQKNAAYRTIMMLMDQPEYKMVKSLKHSNVVPRIYGTCGPMFLEESCPSGPLDVQLSYFSRTKPFPTSSSSSAQWREKASVAIGLLELLDHFERDFPQPLHLCDVKGSNFGMCVDGVVKMIDMDSVFFNTTMYNIFNLSTCKTHDDCNFFDCRGWCDVATGKCYSIRTNNNLQLVCDDVLTGPLPAVFDAGGLLSAAPASVAKELHAALDECIVQTGVEKGVPVYKPPPAIQRKIIRLLQHSIAHLDSS
ncbi:hypothetical protein BaRGS_00027037 [Batillaria attramentaria]|uniref:FAM69 N-terminal domain-containing protein n=1 Tax=Batillaria attramentaria TaxID=370345 RepID=A0ABD0K3P0_9CAEN